MAFTDKTSTPVSELPKPELNPMMNPTLGRNLGRWAHVYFTSPPEKREEAVTELLRELECDTPESSTFSQHAQPGASRILQREQLIKEFFDTSERVFSDEAEPEHLLSQASDQPVARTELICPACSSRNSREQKYCGNCGAPLSTNTRDIDTAQPTRRYAPPQTHDDTQWLRERALSSFEQYDRSGSGGWKYLILIFLILFAGFAYMRWVQSRPSLVTASKSAAASELAAPPSDTTTPVPQPATARSADSAQVTKEDPAGPKAATPQVTQNPVPAALLSKEPDTKPSGLPGSAEVPSPGGHQDVLLAQKYLEGRSGSRNAPQAAQLLWRAVAKQNSDAALLLSDLYARGDGVPKSCDQARLLLVAAAKKGSAQAAQQLRTFYSHGCR